MKTMAKHSVKHETFVIERVYDATPAAVFKAFGDREAKMRWFGDQSAGAKYSLDFRVGGKEHSSGGGPEGMTYSYDATYEDIVPDERIVYTYWMTLGGPRISVSLSTIELRPEGKQTRLVYTEQGAFLDGLDKAAQREHGTRELLDKIATTL
jgi:uncharacterized protein YndB with AHSA1/START domain